ncbi:hypothetical protein GCM10009638_07770 [Luteococcus sanguinis]
MPLVLAISLFAAPVASAATNEIELANSGAAAALRARETEEAADSSGSRSHAQPKNPGTKDEIAPSRNRGQQARTTGTAAVSIPAPDAAFPQLCGGASVGPMCIVDGELPEATPATPAPAPPTPAGEAAAAPAPAAPDPYVLVSRALAQLTLPDAVPSISPDPANNEWGMLAVGLPVWFSSDEPASVDASTTQQGIAITLVATKQSTTLDLGDGSTIVCTSMTVRPISAPAMQKSPDCGHTYVTHGDYTITATTVWNLDWAALGQSGSFRMQMSGSSDLKVGELTSKVVR